MIKTYTKKQTFVGKEFGNGEPIQPGEFDLQAPATTVPA
jgi:hypothetical protein